MYGRFFCFWLTNLINNVDCCSLQLKRDPNHLIGRLMQKIQELLLLIMNFDINFIE